MYRVHFYQTTNYEQNKSKKGKTRNCPCTWKSYSTSDTGISGCKEKEVIINIKTATLSNFDNWKKRQQDQLFILKTTLIE